MFPIEPAVKSYFFGKGYKDLLSTINASWDANQKAAASHFDQFGKGEMLSQVFHVGAGLSVTIFGTAFFLLLSALHITVLGAMFLAIYLIFSILWLFERAWLAVHGFYTVCPACHSRNPLPAYVCSCGATHARLIPSSYGILFRICNCGKRLPATFFLNRGKLISKCQDCGHFLSRAHTEAKKTFVPVIGGPSTGKTAYLTWLVANLSTRASEVGLNLEFLDSAEKDAFESRLGSMQAGQMPEKTVETTPSAFNVVFSFGGNPQRNLYLYDPAGEAYLGESELIPHRFLEYCSGILFLIDPFSIRAVQKIYGVDPDRPGELRPSRLRPDDLLDRLVFVLEKYFHQDSSSVITIPIAIVLTKVDAFDLESVLGKGDADIERKLREWGMTPLVEVLKARFSRRRFFTCSAVGLNHGQGRSFHPRRVAEPFDWLMSESSTQLFSHPPENGLARGGGSDYLFDSVPKATIVVILVLVIMVSAISWDLSRLFGSSQSPEHVVTVPTNSNYQQPISDVRFTDLKILTTNPLTSATNISSPLEPGLHELIFYTEFNDATPGYSSFRTEWFRGGELIYRDNATKILFKSGTFKSNLKANFSPGDYVIEIYANELPQQRVIFKIYDKTVAENVPRQLLKNKQKSKLPDTKPQSTLNQEIHLSPSEKGVNCLLPNGDIQLVPLGSCRERSGLVY